MQIVHDCLDVQLIDRSGTKMGRVDSVVATVDGDGPPCIVAVEVGPVPLAHRLHPRIGRWVARWLERRSARAARPYRIEWDRLTRDGNDFRVDVDARETPAWALEDWARANVVGRIPGA